MPTYEYACKKCSETIEIFQSFSDKPLKKHPECGGELKKVFHARGIVFKGGGFYATDSKGKSSETSKAADSSSESPAKPKKSDKGEKAATSSASPAKSD